MKKIFQILLIIFNLPAVSLAQPIQNGDFAINQGNIVNNPVCFNFSPPLTGYMINEGSGFPNWHITHGTPNFEGAGPFANDIIMVSHKSYNGEGVGEGIVGGYNFYPGNVYTLRLGLRYDADPDIVKVTLVKANIPYSSNCDKIKCNSSSNYNGTLPTVSSSNRLDLVFPSYVSGANDIIFSVDQEYNWVWIYAHNENKCDGFIQVVGVAVGKHCKEILYLFDNVIPAQYYTGYTKIGAGSTFGGMSYMSSISGPTILEATEVIVFESKLDISAAKNEPFEARIDPQSCGRLPVGVLPKEKSDDFARNDSKLNITNVRGDYRKEESIEPNKVRFQEGVEFYPNPVTDIMNINLASHDNCTINLLSIDGKMLTSITAKKLVESVSFKHLDPGIYLVHVSGPTINVTRKIVKAY